MKLKLNWTLLISWVFLCAFILLLVGWYEFNWSLFKVLPWALSSLFLFFQSLTLANFKNKFYASINTFLFAIQVILLLLFILKAIEITHLWKWNIFLLFIATQIYLVDLNERFSISRPIVNWLLRILVVISCFCFLLLSFSYEFVTVGFISMIATSIIVIGNIFFFKEKVH